MIAVRESYGAGRVWQTSAILLTDSIGLCDLKRSLEVMVRSVHSLPQMRVPKQSTDTKKVVGPREKCQDQRRKR